MLGVVKFVPVNKLEPPLEAVYQLTDAPADDVAFKIVELVLQKLLGVTPIIDGRAFTVTTIAVRVPVVHPLEVAST